MSCVKCKSAFFNYGASKNSKRTQNAAITISTIGDIAWATIKYCNDSFGFSGYTLQVIDRILIGVPVVTFIGLTALGLIFSKRAQPDEEAYSTARKHLFTWNMTFIVILARMAWEIILSNMADYAHLPAMSVVEFLKESFPAILEIVFIVIINFGDRLKNCWSCLLPNQQRMQQPIGEDEENNEVDRGQGLLGQEAVSAAQVSAAM